MLRMLVLIAGLMAGQPALAQERHAVTFDAGLTRVDPKRVGPDGRRNDEILALMAAALSAHGTRPELQFLLIARSNPDCRQGGAACPSRKVLERRVALVSHALRAVPRQARIRLRWQTASWRPGDSQDSVELAVEEARLRLRQATCPWAIEVRDPHLPPRPDGKAVRYLAYAGLYLGPHTSIQLRPTALGRAEHAMALIVGRDGTTSSVFLANKAAPGPDVIELDPEDLAGIRLMRRTGSFDLPADVLAIVERQTRPRVTRKGLGDMLAPVTEATPQLAWPFPELVRQSQVTCDFMRLGVTN